MTTRIWLARACAPFAVAALLSGCGGGGGGGGDGGGGGGGSSTRISISPASVSFVAVEGGTVAPVTVRVSYSGAGVVAGYAPGVTPASWLSIEQSSGSADTVEFRLTAIGATFGTSTTSVRFATGTASGGNIRFVDLPVSYTLTPSDLAVSAAPTTVRFEAVVGGPEPAAQPLAITFNGDRAQLISWPSWVNAQPPANTTTSPATWVLTPSGVGPAGGNLTGTISFITTRNGGAIQRQVNVPVEYAVIEPFSATAPALDFSSVTGSSGGATPASGHLISVRGTNAVWRASSDQPWLRVTPPVGTGPGSVTVSVDPTGLGTAVHTGRVTIIDDASGQSRSFDARLDLHAARLTVAPTSLSFVVDSATTPAELARTLTVSDELGGSVASEAVSWNVISTGAPWLQVAPPSGSSVPPASATIALVPDEVGRLASGVHQAAVRLRYSNAQSAAQELELPVELDLRLPTVTFVAPYVGLANVGGPLTLRGEGFTTAGAGEPTVRIGNTEVPAIRESDTQIRLDYPALAAGRYPVGIRNAAGIVAPRPELVVIQPPALDYAAIVAPTARRRLVWDAERGVLYAANVVAGQVERFRYSAGAWTTLAPYTVVALTDIELAPDGRTLVVLSRDAVREINLTAGPFSAVLRAENPDPFCGSYFDQVVGANHGHMFVVYKYSQCSGFSSSYIYDLSRRILVSGGLFDGGLYNGLAGGSADGSRIYAGSNGVSPAQPVKIFRALDDSITHSPAEWNLSAISVGGDASRVILQNRSVYNRELTALGRLPGDGVAMVSHDSTRAFVYRDDGDQPRIEVYDITGALLDPDALYELERTIELPDSPSTAAGQYGTIAFSTTPDGSVIFVSGDARVLVVPVD